MTTFLQLESEELVQVVFRNKKKSNYSNVDTSNSSSKNDLATEHKNICESLNAVYELKNSKYGDSFGQSVREFGYIAALTRISDKYNRIKQLILTEQNGNDTDESLEDSLLDLANYCIMTTMELNNKKNE